MSKLTSESDGNLIIFQDMASQSVQVRLEGETLWLSQQQMAEVFERDRTVITRHLNNTFKGELDKKSNVQNIHFAYSNSATVSNYLSWSHHVEPLNTLEAEMGSFIKELGYGAL